VLVLIFGVALVIYCIFAYRITPERFEKFPEAAVHQHQQLKIQNCRRYAGLFIFYIFIAIGAGLSFGHIPQLISQVLIGIEIIYLLAVLVWIGYREHKQRQVFRAKLQA